MAPRDALIAGVGRVFRHHRRVSAVLYVVGVLGVLSLFCSRGRCSSTKTRSCTATARSGSGRTTRARAHEYALKAEGVIDALGADADGDQIYDALTAFAAARLDALGLDVSTREYPMDADGRGRRRAGEKRRRRERRRVPQDDARRGSRGEIVRTRGCGVRHPVGASDTDGPRADAAAIGVGLAFVEYLTTAKWLAKDFVWLVLDARAGSTPGGARTPPCTPRTPGSASTTATRARCGSARRRGRGSVRPRRERAPARCSRRTCSRCPPAPPSTSSPCDRKEGTARCPTRTC